jgi:hypothetical protein
MIEARISQGSGIPSPQESPLPPPLKLDSGSITYQQLADGTWTATVKAPYGLTATGDSMDEARLTLLALLVVSDEKAPESTAA